MCQQNRVHSLIKDVSIDRDQTVHIKGLKKIEKYQDLER